MPLQTAYEEVQRRNFQNLFLPIDPINPMLVLHVTRHNIVTDTLHQLSRQGPADLKKPLKVTKKIKVITCYFQMKLEHIVHLYFL